ncbi:uncharacterized protein LOC118430158 [Branchiostoma floridae]|uniref:Uncharacterized protein LOC118430158 n=1 Tax=Branchiostoma floridae TaxID=7739 RepID=A0A9J7MCP5_BRAFL|nr:uncharacterized protein LOC118430158 [Branchiostoma floridae]
MEESYSCPDCAFTANRDLVLQVLRHFFNCTSFRCIQDISCGHNLGLSTPRPQTQQGNSNCSQKNSCYADKSTKERRDSPVQSAFATANVPLENTDSLYSPHSTRSSTATNGFIFQSDNSNRSNGTGSKEVSSMDLSEHDSEEIVDEQCNTDSTENMQLHTGRNLTLNIPDRQAAPCRIESYFSVKPHKSGLPVACQSSENVMQEKTDSGSGAVSAQNLRMATFHDSVATDTARSDTLMQVQVKVEPSTEEYGHCSTGAQGESSTEGLYKQSSHLTVGPAIPSVVGNWDSIQQMRRDPANAGAPTSASEGVSANSQELHSGQQVSMFDSKLGLYNWSTANEVSHMLPYL